MNISNVTRTKQEAQATYNRISRWYDVLEGVWETKARVVGLNKIAPKPGEIILEIGVGTGHSLVTLAQAVGQSGQVYGLDLAPRMLDISQERARTLGIADRVHLMQGDAVELPFTGNHFDAIFSNFTLELFDTPEIPLVLSRCRRGLRDGGRICVVSLSQAGQSTWMRELYQWGHQQFPRFLDCRPIFVEKALETNGFQILEADQMPMWGLPVEVVLAEK